MATIEQDHRSISPIEPGIVEPAYRDNLFQALPPSTGGASEAELSPMFDTVVDSDFRLSKAPEKIEGVGTFWLERWRMTDGTLYDILIGEPETCREDIAVFSSPTWGSRINGVPEHLANLLMRSGLRTFMIGTEIGQPLTPDQIAHNMHQIMNEADRRGMQEPKKAIWIGISRSAMMAFGIINHARANDREIVYSDIVDPVMPEKIHLTDPLQLAELLQYLPREIRGLISHLLTVPRKDILKIYLPTVGIDRIYIGQVINGGIPLFSGEYGQMAAEMPIETNMHVTFYQGCAANQHKRYLQLLKRYPGVVSEVVDGVHTEFLKPHELGKVICRLVSLADQLAEVVKTSEIDFNRVHWPVLNLLS